MRREDESFLDAPPPPPRFEGPTPAGHPSRRAIDAAVITLEPFAADDPCEAPTPPSRADALTDDDLAVAALPKADVGRRTAPKAVIVEHGPVEDDTFLHLTVGVAVACLVVGAALLFA